MRLSRWAAWFSRPAVTWILGAGLVLLLLGMVYRQPLADWLWPEKRAIEMRDAAVVALGRGHLTAPDGSGARELYEAAIAIDPDRRDTRAGLVEVGRAALARAQAALAKEDFDAAHRDLALARDLAVPREETDAFEARLREREAGLAGIERMLALAAAARDAGRFDGDANAALPLYQRILELQPERHEALEGREDTLSDVLAQARQRLERGEVSAAAQRIEVAARYDGGHFDLPAIRAELAGALDRLRASGARSLRRGSLRQAADAYAAVLAVAPDDAGALRGRAQVAAAHADNARRAAADFRFKEAEAALREARRLAPGVEAIPAAERAVVQARQAHARLSRVTNQGTQRDRRGEVRELLRLARQAEERGDLLSPPGESAFDRLRAARALAPADPDVRSAQRRLAPAARQCFERELPRNNLRRAQGCLDAWAALEGRGEAHDAARRRLARRWLAIADERLGAGELGAATAAMREAEGLDRGAEGLDDFRRRLGAATASGD